MGMGVRVRDRSNAATSSHSWVDNCTSREGGVGCVCWCVCGRAKVGVDQEGEGEGGSGGEGEGGVE